MAISSYLIASHHIISHHISSHPCLLLLLLLPCLPVFLLQPDTACYCLPGAPSFYAAAPCNCYTLAACIVPACLLMPACLPANCQPPAWLPATACYCLPAFQPATTPVPACPPSLPPAGLQTRAYSFFPGALRVRAAGTGGRRARLQARVWVSGAAATHTC